MPAGTDLIFFDNSNDWQVVADVTRKAVRVGEKSYIPIPAFDLGLSLNTDYVAVVATTGSGKPTWQFAGDINQVYNFAPGGTDSITGKIQPVCTKLFLNKLTLVETNRVSTDAFDLRYQPPYWFRDCTIRVYKYIGDKINFVEDTLFEIGNALGTNPNTQGTTLNIQFDLIKVLINSKFEQLRQENEEFQLANIQDRLEILDQIDRVDGGIYTLAEGLADLLPGDRGAEIRQATQNRLNLDLGFL